MASIAYYSKAEIRVNGKLIGEATDIQVETAKSLPKPRRVEKWQRWRDSKGVEFTAIESCGKSPGGLLEKWLLRKDGCDGQWYGVDMPEGRQWTFLGYAKPDKVEVGQWWREFGTDKTVVDVSAGAATIRSSAVGVDDEWIPCDTMTRLDRWEYLGMTESADPQQVAPITENATTDAPLVSSDMRKALERVSGWRVVSSSAFTRTAAAQPPQSADKAKQDARRANEEAAKRLIANPPEWAYPKAWMCAVLCKAERHGMTAAHLDREFAVGGCYELALRMYAQRRREGQPHDEAKRRTNITEIADAYARGMERPSPLMGRPGVKGGISTCDLGAEYE